METFILFFIYTGNDYMQRMYIVEFAYIWFYWIALKKVFFFPQKHPVKAFQGF